MASEVLPSCPLRLWIVSVRDYPESEKLWAKTRGKAQARVWYSDAFSHLSFSQFMAQSTARLHPDQPEPRLGYVSGKEAWILGTRGPYVEFVWPDGDHPLVSHPTDVEYDCV